MIGILAAEASANGANNNDVLIAVCVLAGIIFGGLTKIILSARKLRVDNKTQHEDNKAAFLTTIGELKGTVTSMRAEHQDAREEVREGFREVRVWQNDHAKNHPVISSAPRQRKPKA